MTDNNLPYCGDCGSNDWNRVLEQTKSSGRRKRVFECQNCGAEGRVFDKHGPTVYSGAMRHAGVVA